MKVDVLYFDGCPHLEPTLELLHQVASEHCLRPEVRTLEIRSAEDAQRRQFLGSPTVRVDGQDVDPAVANRRDYGMSCRVYGGAHVPPRDLIERALLERRGS